MKFARRLSLYAELLSYALCILTREQSPRVELIEIISDAFSVVLVTRRFQKYPGIESGIGRAESVGLRTVDIIANNCVIAHGEVGVVEGNFGVRIKQIISRQDRLRSLS